MLDDDGVSCFLPTIAPRLMDAAVVQVFESLMLSAGGWHQWGGREDEGGVGRLVVS